MYARRRLLYTAAIRFGTITTSPPCVVENCWVKVKSIHTTPSSQPTASLLKAQEELESILQKSSSASLPKARQLHAQLILNGLVHNNSGLGPKLLGIYVLCDCFNDAQKMFSRLQFGSAMPWNWMIRGFVNMGCPHFALLFYFKMLGCGVPPDKYTFPPVIKACCGLNHVKFGRMLRDTILSMDFDVDVFVGSSLIKLYAQNGCLADARLLFDNMLHRDLVLWNVIIHGSVKCGDLDGAAQVFRDMRISGTRPDSVTFASLLSACASQALVAYGAQLHGLAIFCGLQNELLVANTLVAMYSKCGLLLDARRLFGMMPQTDLLSWNNMIGGYVQSGFMEEALTLFREMLPAGFKPDSVTLASFLPAVTESANLRRGKEVHGHIVRHGVTLDVFLKSALIDLYFKCRDVEMACKIFEQSAMIDIVICTAMISGYVLNGMNHDAVEIFRWLLQENMTPNALTLSSVLPAFAGLAALQLGKELHGNILKNGLESKCHVGSAIMDMYAKCGRLDLACIIFARISEKDVVCWNSIITSCCQNGKPEEAIDLFRRMGIEGMHHNCVSVSSALSACANLPALMYGKEIHGFMIKRPLKTDLFAESALIDMYAKCGNLKVARHVFDVMEGKTEVAWNSMIAAYGTHGCLDEALALLHKMLENGIRPDNVTFLGIISACGHTGRIDDGFRYFRCMTEEYGIPAQMEHYACLVDLLGRAGCLTESFEIIKGMPFSPDAGVWGTLLGACRVHGNVDLAEMTSRYLHDLDPRNSGYYVLLSNVNADAGKWRSVAKVRNLMKEGGVQKIPGYSWIEINSITHTFCAADRSHPHYSQIYSTLNSLLLELRREGYVPQPYRPTH
ncbi:hypothetical protein Tsubulata_014467 [Turnera subulata]|uniref:DYW domain-containing protein n=1 Tax=Turnera subulata TaxID=218843 RepID=A0A9Q0G8J6_9ROSI|nr:hypothetical protein Tsubulata_014467 [Turnera subulata]